MGFDLGALLKDVSNFGTGREQIEYIRLDLIDGDPNNFYQLSDIDKLAANIELCGLQQPLRVRTHPDNPERYMIVSGHRRRAALKMLAADDSERWEEVPCIQDEPAASPTLQQLQLIFFHTADFLYCPIQIAPGQNLLRKGKITAHINFCTIVTLECRR